MSGRLIPNVPEGSDDWSAEIESKDILKKGQYNVDFNNFEDGQLVQPVIKAGSSIDINGVIYKFDSDESIGSTIPDEGSSSVVNVFYVTATGGSAATVDWTEDDAFSYNAEKSGWYGVNGEKYIAEFKQRLTGSYPNYYSEFYDHKLIDNGWTGTVAQAMVNTLGDYVTNYQLSNISNTQKEVTAQKGSAASEQFGATMGMTSTHIVMTSKDPANCIIAIRHYPNQITGYHDDAITYQPNPSVHGDGWGAELRCSEYMVGVGERTRTGTAAASGSIILWSGNGWYDVLDPVRIWCPEQIAYAYFGRNFDIYEDRIIASENQHANSGEGGVWVWEVDHSWETEPELPPDYLPVEPRFEFYPPVELAGPGGDIYWGTEVCLTDDYAIVGCPNAEVDDGEGGTINESGAVYMFERLGVNSWGPRQLFPCSYWSRSDRGSYIYWDNKGKQLIVSAGTSSMYVYQYKDGVFCEEERIPMSPDGVSGGTGYLAKIREDVCILGSETAFNVEQKAGGFMINKRKEDGTWRDRSVMIYPNGIDPQYQAYFGSSLQMEDGQCWVGGRSMDTSAGSGAGRIFNYLIPKN